MEPHPAGAHPGCIQHVGEDGRSIGGFHPRRPPEVDSLVAADDLQRVEQRRLADTSIRLFGNAVQVEQAPPGAFFVGASVGRPQPLQVRLVDDREAPVESLQGERHGMEIRQRGQQTTLLGEGVGGSSGELCNFRQREPGCRRERHRARQAIAIRPVLHRIDQVHEQARALCHRHPRNATSGDNRAGTCRQDLPGLDQNIRPWSVCDIPGEHGRDLCEPQVDMRRQFCVADGRQACGREAPQHGARQPLGDKTQSGVFLLRSDTGQQAP